MIDRSRRLRIAVGSGTGPMEVKQFLKQFDQVRVVMRRMAQMSLWERLKMILGIDRLPPDVGRDA
jgi:signal recognition particle subunit SRP54